MIEHQSPFRHWQHLAILPSRIASALPHAIPPADWPHWVRYSSAWEAGKRTCRDPMQLPSVFAQAMAWLASPDFTYQLRGTTGIPDLIFDPLQHGGGLHVTDPGGRLDCHLDYALHPMARFLERRVNVVVFLNECEGGKLQLWNDDASEPVKEYAPYHNAAVAWECSDVAYHGVAEVTGDTPRATLAAYYCSPVRPGVVRKRALFVPQRANG